MICKTIELAKEKQCSAVTLQALEKSRNARRLYEENSFQELKTTLYRTL